jgi:hypothetical protein
MKQMPIALTVLTLSTTAVVVSAQRPDFSGTWKLDEKRSSAIGGGRGGGRGEGNSRGGGLGLGASPDTIAIVQTAETLVVEERRGAETARITYGLDGKPVTNGVASGRSAGTNSTYTSAWKGDRLVTTIVIPPAPGGGEIGRYQETRSIDRDGSLVVEITMAGRPNSRKLVYVRAK